jgi:FkbM family methyltransferase
MLASITGPDGLVLAFEPGPPFALLQINTWLNAADYTIHAYNFAIDAQDGEWCYKSGCNGCNGGKVDCGTAGSQRFIAHTLDDVLAKNYPPDVIKQISFVKIDAEGHDMEILASFKNSPVLLAKPIIQVEWFIDFRKDFCTQGTQGILQAAHEIGYEVYHISGIDINVFDKKETCEDLKPDSAQDLYLFPKERLPMQETKTGKSRTCP